MKGGGSRGTERVGSADIVKILDLLPHRYPFLLIDEMIEVKAPEMCIGVKNVTVNEPFFGGHFPGYPIMPGVLIVEGMAQAASVMYLLDSGKAASERGLYFLGIDKARFRKPVFPGHQLRYHVRTLQCRGGVYRFFAEGKVGGVVVADAECSIMLTGQ